ncbi:MAG: hypothetical protein IJQ10_00155 [Clostridia bacterium]|nr:hypothetical protein [Clostridia bacterium]
MNLFFIVFCAFFMILGFVDFIKFIFFKIFKKTEHNIKSSDSAEFVIRDLANKNLWNKNFSKLVCIESDDNETKKIIEIAQNEYDFLNFEPNFKVVD